MSKRLDKNMETWAGSLGPKVGALTADNMATAFQPHQPMNTPGTDPTQHTVKGDVPSKLKKAVNQGLRAIDPECIKQNAEMLLELFEDICLKHVLQKQLPSKILNRLKAMDPELQYQDNTRKVVSGCVAKSSLIGRDPWGDDAPALDGDAQNADDTPKTYTEAEILLVEIQDQNYNYLVAHVAHILDDVLHTKVKARELEYHNDEDSIHTETNRNRMPWKEYKRIILEDLPVGTGVHELRQLMCIIREENDSARKWVQRIEIGKTLTGHPASRLHLCGLCHCAPHERGGESHGKRADRHPKARPG